MHASLSEAIRHGFAGGTIPLETFLVVKTLKMLVVALAFGGIMKELGQLLR